MVMLRVYQMLCMRVCMLSENVCMNKIMFEYMCSIYVAVGWSHYTSPHEDRRPATEAKFVSLSSDGSGVHPCLDIASARTLRWP